jgi:streptogramin lyase
MPTPPPAPQVSTVAGSGNNAFADGQGTSASFSFPYGVAVDPNGNAYVGDSTNYRIRKITASGNVTTLAGSSWAFADGQGTAAKFKTPYGVAVDKNANVYVADFGNCRIRKITPNGNVTTLAGSGVAGNADGQGTAASFSYPIGVAVDTNGNVYVADYGNHRIRKITASGNVTTLAGSGTAGYANGQGTAASFNAPTGIAVDTNGNVYVGDQSNNRIRKITPSGNVSTLAGSGNYAFADGQGAVASFSSPAGVAVDASGNLYVADYGNNRIRKITPSGTVTTVGEASFNAPAGVAVAANGNLYVADMYNHKIQKINISQ